MAIETNSRKRKHQHAKESKDDAEVAVPHKMAKKIKSPKKQKKLKNIPQEPENNVDNAELEAQETVEQDMEEVHNGEEEVEESYADSGFEPDEQELKFSKDFKMFNFRTKLRGNNFITELRHFLHLASIRPKIVAKYIEKRGKPLELAEALERVDKSNVLHTGYLCQALQLVVMEIISNQPNHMESAVHACRYFLKSHGAIVESLLKSAQLKHRRIALKLLTAIVCAEPQLGRQLLSSYDILSNVKTIENFLSHSRFEMHEEETVRKCFIHFVLAYLVDGNTLLIRNILDRGTLIRALASGLLYDDHVTVCVVLSTLKKYVLECAEISKTKKINVFDVECCKHIARLYDWHGPKVYAAKFGGKNGAQVNLQSQQINELVDEQQREAVASVLHEFLLVLLTSRKFGITFDAVTFFRQKHNAIQGKIIGFLYKPWCSERKTALIIQILKACPDLARHTVRNFASIVNPMRTPARDWVQAANFLSEIIRTLHPKLLRNALNKITLTDFSYWVKDICLPIESLVLLTGSKMLRHANFGFRLATNRLLLAMFTQYSNYMAAIAKIEQFKGGNALRRFKFDILNHILVNFPTVEDILVSLHMSIEAKAAEGVSVLSHLDVTLDLVLIICKENRSFVNKTSTILDYLELLRPLYANDDIATAGSGNIKLELKAIKTILLLFPKALEPNEELFSSVLKSFVKAFVHGSADVAVEAGVLLRGMFKNTGLFDSCEWEIDLWLEALRFFDAATVDVVTQVFIEVLQVTKAEVDAPKTSESLASGSNLQQLFENIEKGLSVQAYIETIAISKLMALIFKGVEIAQPLDRYLETVCLLMYHYYPTPEHVVHLYEMKFNALEKYMHSWLPSGNSEALLLAGKTAELVPKVKELQSAIVEGKSKFEDIFVESKNSGDAFEIELDGKLVNFNALLQNERLLMIYVQQILFIVAQLVAKQQLQHAQAERAAEFAMKLLSLVRALEERVRAKQENAEEPVETETDSYLGQILKYIFSIRISYIRSTVLLSAGDEAHLNYLHFLRLLTEHCKDMPDFATYAANYRLKLVKAVAISLQNVEETKQHSEQLAESIQLIEAFNLDVENCKEILELLATHLKYSDFFLEGSSQKSIYYELLVHVLQRLATLQKAVKCDVFVKRFAKCYVNFIKKLEADVNLEQLEEAFYNFLQISHHHIPELGVKFFDSMFAERKLTKSSIKLAALLLERDDELQAAFLAHLPLHVEKKELIYPLLNVLFEKHCVLETTLLQKVYQTFKSGFMKTIEKPQKAGAIYKENVACSVALIEACMPASECVDFCKKQFKFDATELYQMRVIQAIYKKALQSLSAESVQLQTMVFVNFINLQVQLLAVDLKKQVYGLEKMELFGYYLQNWWQLAEQQAAAPEAETLLANADYSKILKSQQWLNFCKSCLKVGMYQNEADVEAAATVNAFNGLLLKVLAYLCDQLYADYSDEKTKGVEYAQEPGQLFEMICSHSKFYELLLAQTSASSGKVKTAILSLLYTLGKKCPPALATLKIPIILGAYQARLADADRYVLALLQLYERYDSSELQKYRPFIWGESAVAFYSLRDDGAPQSNLTQQETSIAQVLSLIDRQLCEYTNDNFPIWRKLDAAAQLPVTHFADPAQKPLIFGGNPLEKRIELGASNFTEADLRLCPKREGIYEQCYDPAFFIPLMSMCCAPEAYVHPARPVQNGLLSMVFAALSSQDRDMRLAAGCVQLRYRAHFEQNKFFERPLWIQTYENIQAGLSDLREAWLKHKRNSGTPRVPFISGLFVAKSLNLTTDPTHLLYKQLTMYLRLKSSFNFQTVPEFNILFYSPEVEHHAFRQFIVETIRNGIKSSSDLFLLVTTNTFKVLQGFYGSTMSTLEMNLLILSVFSTCVKIPASSKILIEHVGILPWLSSVISTLEFYHFDVIEGVISCLNNLWYAVKANAAEFHNFTHISLEIHQLVLSLLPHLSARIAVPNFARLVNILYKTSDAQHLSMSSTQLDNLIDCAQRHFPAHVHSISAIRELGGAGALSHKAYCAQLHQQQVDSVAIQALTSLRSYVMVWWQCQQQADEATNMLNDTTAE